MGDVTQGALSLALFGFLFAGVVKGATGLGFSSTCLPFLVLALGLDRAMPLVLVPSITSNLIVHFQAGEFRRTVTMFWPMFVATVPGLLVGLWLLTRADVQVASAVLGLVLIVYSLWTLMHIDAALPAHWIPPLKVPVGALTGLVNGLTGSQIMPVLPFLLSQPLERNIFLQSINISFTASSLIVAIGLWTIGFLTPEIAVYSVAALIPMAAGITMGTVIRNKLDAVLFRKMVLILLIGLGAALALRGIT